MRGTETTCGDPRSNKIDLFAGGLGGGFEARAPRVFSIPAGRPFLKDLARGLVAALGRDPLDLARTDVFLPTRRAARAFSEAVLEAAATDAVLAPRVRALGDVDDVDLVFGGDLGADGDALDLPPAASAAERRLVLARLVRARDEALGDKASWTSALAAADALAAFFDSVETEGADLSRLETLVPERFAAHWLRSLDFLRIAVEFWPAWLAERGLIDPARRRRMAIDRLTERYISSPPDRPVLAAGSTGSMPAVARLMGAIASAPRGAVVLPGLDDAMDAAGWAAVDDRHPQGGLKRLLDGEPFGGLAREDVRRWPASDARGEPRRRLLSAALRPADATDGWRDAADDLSADADDAARGLRVVEAADEAEEALAAALLVREALETPGRDVLVVTPDRALARRIAACLARYRIDVDDSAGRPAARTTAGAFLERAAALLAAPAYPARLLALLRHPLARFGLSAADARKAASAIDRGLRGFEREETPAAMLARSLERRKDPLPDDHPARAAAALLAAPLAAAANAPRADAGALLEAHLALAETLAATPERPDGAALWAANGGAEIAAALAEARGFLAAVEKAERAGYDRLFRALLDGVSVRPRTDGHPRVTILGPLEARLQSADLVVLAGLAEGTWPKAAAEDPFLSRGMRDALGLPSPERRIGLAAHDFAQHAASPEVALTYAARSGARPARRSRFLVRLENILSAEGLSGAREAVFEAARHAHWARELDRPCAPKRAAPPRPAPPLSVRPRSFSASELRALVRDPYAIYAKRILGLKVMDPLAAAPDARVKGNVLHDALEAWGAALLRGEMIDADGLLGLLDAMFGDHAVPARDRAAWRPRMARALRWFVEDFQKGRAATVVAVETTGELTLPISEAGDAVLTAKADRIDRAADGSPMIWDYKTGQPPSEKVMRAGFDPQLPLEAMILAAGGYEDFAARDLQSVRFGHLKLNGSGDGGEDKTLDDAKQQDILHTTAERLPALLARYDDPQTPYLSQIARQFVDQTGDYDRLARRGEWSRTGEADE